MEPVGVADWAAPIVPVLKKDKKSIRICGDFRLTINPVSKLDNYPIPRAEDIFATLGKGRYFTKIDLRHAYQQLLLDDESKGYLVINTPNGDYSGILDCHLECLLYLVSSRDLWNLC